MRILPAGDRALLVELDDLDQVLGYYAALTADAPADVVDIVPAARTVLVTTTGDLAALSRTLHELTPTRDRRTTGDLIEIPVIYDGADLGDVADLIGCSQDDVIARHTADEWTVAFCGFAPGFGYLTSTGTWNIPRRSSPRTSGAAGAGSRSA